MIVSSFDPLDKGPGSAAIMAAPMALLNSVSKLRTDQLITSFEKERWETSKKIQSQTLIEPSSIGLLGWRDQICLTFIVRSFSGSFLMIHYLLRIEYNKLHDKSS